MWYCGSVSMNFLILPAVKTVASQPIMMPSVLRCSLLSNLLGRRKRTIRPFFSLVSICVEFLGGHRQDWSAPWLHLQRMKYWWSIRLCSPDRCRTQLSKCYSSAASDWLSEILAEISLL
jgi:hypothetical protein